MDNSSDIDQETNTINIWSSHLDLLDAIEQHYELQHRYRQADTFSVAVTETTPKSDPKEQT